MDFTTLMRSGKQTGDHAMSFHVPETWMQGRTTYGGLTAALCLQAAMPTSGGRQIRSAQVAFVGPVSGLYERAHDGRSRRCCRGDLCLWGTP